MSHPPSTFSLTDGFGKTLVNSSPTERGGLPLVVVSLLGRYKEALSAGMDEDNMGHMKQHGLMGGDTRSGDLTYVSW
jgi:hypothetical protein